MAIAHQTVTAPVRITTRPDRRRNTHGRVAFVVPSRAWTTVRLVGLVGATAMCVAMATAVVVGTALFALLNFAS